MRKPLAVAVAAAVLALGAWAPRPALAQDAGTAGDEGDVYQKDQELLDRAEEMTRQVQGAADESLADKALTYNPDGRRDPFRPLVGGVATDEEQRGRLPGIAGLLFGEVQLVGIVEGATGDPIAIFFGGPEETGYFVHEGMNFYNGSVYDINPVTKSVVIRQQVEDAIIPYKEIDIYLYPDEAEGK